MLDLGLDLGLGLDMFHLSSYVLSDNKIIYDAITSGYFLKLICDAKLRFYPNLYQM